MGSSQSKNSTTPTPPGAPVRRSIYRKPSTNSPKITAKIVVNSAPSSNTPATPVKAKSTAPAEKKRGTFTAAIDQGTTSSRFIIFDGTGTPKATHQVEFEQLYPHSGWIEHDPFELLKSVNTCVERAAEQFVGDGYCLEDIKAIGITNQRETTVVWDTVTGQPLYNAIVWADTRTSRLVHELRKKEGSKKLRALCGLPMSTYPSSVKLLWMLRHVPAVAAAHKAGRLSFGTVDTWLIYNLSGGAEKGRYVTDPSNASRTMFCNIETLEYDEYLLDWFGVKGVNLPQIVPSSDPEAYGVIAEGALKGTRIAGCLGDQSAALVGQCAFNPGMAKNTYGTGCFLLYNTGEKPVISDNGLLTTVGYAFKGHKPVYALEGSVAVAGSAVKFLRDNLGIIKHSHEVGELASKVPDSGGVVFVTAFSGLFAPYWIDDAMGTIFGMSQYTTKEHIARATIEAVCFQTRAILDAMEKDSGTTLNALAVDGGMSNSDVCMQIQADILGLEIDRPKMRETTALGAAIAAGFAVGVWRDLNELKGINREDRATFWPKSSEQSREQIYANWEKAVERSKGWLDNDRIDDDKE